MESFLSFITYSRLSRAGMAVYQSWESRLLPDYLSATPRMLPFSTQSKRAQPSHPHFSLQDKREDRIFTQSCPTLCDPTDCSLPGSPVHEILQARILEWVVFPSTGDLSNPGSIPGLERSPVEGNTTQGSNLGLLHCRQILYKCQGSF